MLCLLQPAFFIAPFHSSAAYTVSPLVARALLPRDCDTACKHDSSTANRLFAAERTKPLISRVPCLFAIVSHETFLLQTAWHRLRRRVLSQHISSEHEVLRPISFPHQRAKPKAGIEWSNMAADNENCEAARANRGRSVNKITDTSGRLMAREQ